MANGELTSLTLVELANLMKTQQVSPVEVMTSYLGQIEQVNKDLNAIVTLPPDLIERARAAEKILMRREAVGSLQGVPVTIKDTIETAGILSTSGSRLRAAHVPSRDAKAVSKLKAAGAIVLGKTNTPEMAIPYETDNPVFGRTNNPLDLQLTPGGSSGGEAAAIAAHISPGGLGSDLSGSIRVPAHFCGIVGLKPTSGRISMAGHVPLLSEQIAFGACIGPMARSVADVGLLFEALTEPRHPIAANQLKGTRIAWYDYDGVAPVSTETKKAVQAAVSALEIAGLEVVHQRPPGIESGARLWIELFSVATADDLRALYSGCEDLAGPVAQRVLRATKVEQRTAEQAHQVLLERNRLREDLLIAMDSFPLLVAPVGATLAFPHGTQRLNVAGEAISVFRAFSYSQTFNVFDLPAIAIPVGRSVAGLPIGVQIVGRPFAEEIVLAAAAIVEESLR